MKIIVDENIPRMTVDHLRELGHDVMDVRGTTAEGVSDADLWARTMAEGRLLVTTDKGFTQYRAADHHGVLIVRLHQPNRHKIHRAVLNAMNRFSPQDWPGLLVVVRDTVMSTSRKQD